MAIITLTLDLENKLIEIEGNDILALEEVKNPALIVTTRVYMKGGIYHDVVEPLDIVQAIQLGYSS
ncbi:hypothetical protein [Dyadobacter crusticola]|uniref:hypothetical protein n=1 Tax=Dyadobacter crusticola TaxID=292407 RepID=UPI0004E1B957|nr:hypothetical protein [Dyadobacter crusticola]